MNVYKTIRDVLEIHTLMIGKQYFPESAVDTSVPEKDIIHIWSATYTDLAVHYDMLLLQLSRNEQEKASSFKKPDDARCFVIRQGCLRLILEYYTGCEPAMIPLVTSKNGKPGMDLKSNFSELSFSLSHTGEMFVIGIRKKYGIGIDIVKMDCLYPFRDAAAYLFNEQEKALVSGSEPAQQYKQFFRIWALKEAILKATGGSALMMKDTDVSGAINNQVVQDFFEIRCQKKPRRFFIQEYGCGIGHHCVIAVNMDT
jgi:phosphopantetheine--protein transferase-like protein